MDFYPNDTQLKLIKLLFEHPNRKYTHTELQSLGIFLTETDSDALIKKLIIVRKGPNEIFYTYKAGSFCSSYYLQYCADSQERADKTEYQEKTIDIGSEGNSISRTANKISIVALVLSGIAILISIASFLLSLLGNPFAI